MALILCIAAGGRSGGGPEALKLVDLEGRQISPLGADGAPAIVFLFTRTDCPISNRYAPEVRRLHQKFAPLGVRFWLVYLDPGEPIETIRTHLKDYSYDLPVLRDPRHELVDLAGVTITPEAAVFTKGAQLAYRGRIDDRYVTFGQQRPAPTIRDLQLALEAVLEGRPVVPKTTQAVGCYIEDLRSQHMHH